MHRPIVHCRPIGNKKHLKKCWAHSPQRADSRQFTRCRRCTVARRLRIDVHDAHDDDNDNAWQRGPLWPHGMGPISYFLNICRRLLYVDLRLRMAWLLCKMLINYGLVLGLVGCSVIVQSQTTAITLVATTSQPYHVIWPPFPVGDLRRCVTRRTLCELPGLPSGVRKA